MELTTKELVGLPADIIRLISLSHRTLPVTMRLTCRRFRDILGSAPARSFIVDCEISHFYSLLEWALEFGARLTPEYTDALAAAGNVDRVRQMRPPLSDTCVGLACAKGDVAMTKALIALGNVYDFNKCMDVIDGSADWSGTPFARRGWMENDGREDRMLMATQLLNRRLMEIQQRREAVTLGDVERTHIMFINQHFKPFEAYGPQPN